MQVLQDTFIPNDYQGSAMFLHPSMMEHRVLSLDNSTFCKSFKFIVYTKVLLTFMNETHNKQKVFASETYLDWSFVKTLAKFDTSLETRLVMCSFCGNLVFREFNSTCSLNINPVKSDSSMVDFNFLAKHHGMNNFG